MWRRFKNAQDEVYARTSAHFAAQNEVRIANLARKQALCERAEALAARMGLPLGEMGERSPYALSGGEQRRLSVATALCRRPAALLLDEPTFGQDRRGWEALAGILDELVDEGTAVLAATHDERFAARVADRRVEMAEGWIVADDGPGRAADEPWRHEVA